MSTEVKIPNTPIRFMLFALRPFWIRAVLVMLLVTTAQLLGNGTSYVLKYLVDGLSSSAAPEEALATLKYWGLVYVCITIAVFACWRLSGLVGVYALAGSKAYSYKVLFEYLSKHSHEYFSDHFAGSVSNKVSHASDGADGLIEQVWWHYYPSVLGMVATAALLFTASFYVGVVFIGLCVLLVIVNAFLVRRRHHMVVAYSNASSALRGVAVDIITNIFAVMQYARYPFEMRRLGEYVEDRRVKDLRRDLSAEIGLTINNIIISITILGIGVVVYQSFKQGLMSTGEVVMVTTLLWDASYSLVFIGNMLNGFMRGYGEIQEGLEEVLLPHSLVDVSHAEKLQVSKGDIVFNDVTFSYEEQIVFDKFELTIPHGQRVGLVGKSGAGKTTFVSLLLRNHDVASGAIRIDGQDISQCTQDSLREVIGIVPQEPMLFHRSLRENIAYGKPDAIDVEVMQAARLAEAHEFIEALPQGYETLVGERGVKLSGGQRQRVAIARAILKNAPILVLDEATSALDSESEVAIQKALHELMEGKTVIAIAHRLSTLREMDRIIVLDQGAIAEEGTHDELVKKGGIYARLWEHQAGGFLQE